MDSQLAFFLVRPAKAMGRKGADPDAVILAGHSKTPADCASNVPICRTDFFTQETWGRGVTSMEAVARGTDTAGMLQERDPVCPAPRRPCRADGQGGVSALGSPGLTPPRAGFELGLTPHCTPKASSPAGWGGLLGWGQSLCGPRGATVSLVGPFGAAWGPLSPLRPTGLGSEVAAG